MLEMFLLQMNLFMDMFGQMENGESELRGPSAVESTDVSINKDAGGKEKDERRNK